MSIKEAIKKAIDDGYLWKGYADFRFADEEIIWVSPVRVEILAPEQILLDPAFWQSLGKAMGWDNARHESGFAQFSGAWEAEEEKARNHWRTEWHRFIEHLADGKSAKSFFDSLAPTA